MHEHSRNIKLPYHVLPFFLVVLELVCFVTVLQLIFRNPFVTIFSSLCRYTSYSCELTAKINLKPLIAICIPRCPRSSFDPGSIYFEVQSTLEGMVSEKPL